jgi:hypothetical protein
MMAGRLGHPSGSSPRRSPASVAAHRAPPPRLVGRLVDPHSFRLGRRLGTAASTHGTLPHYQANAAPKIHRCPQTNLGSSVEQQALSAIRMELKGRTC